MTTTGVYHTSYRSELRLRHTRAEQVRLWAAVILILLLPFILSPFWLSVANRIGIAVIGAIGLNILTGFTGQISLGQGGFLAVGAYTSGLLVVRLGLPTLVAMFLAVAFTALVGALIGLPALRLKGLYLAIATLASQFIIIYLVRNWEFITQGRDSISVPRPELFGFVLIGDFRWYWPIMGCAALATIVG
ncbi:MAG: branched-chain amino acid ABC transporter permease, partial [Nitriliruptor sp.]